MKRLVVFTLIVILSLSSVITATQILPNLVESAIARPTATTNPEIAKATTESLLKDKGKSQSKLIVRRVSVEGKYAIATWQWGEAGGQSMLIQQGKRWKVIASGGGALDVETLKQKGIPTKTAERLMQQEQAAQKR